MLAPLFRNQTIRINMKKYQKMLVYVVRRMW